MGALSGLTVGLATHSLFVRLISFDPSLFSQLIVIRSTAPTRISTISISSSI